MTRTDSHLDGVLRHLGAAYYESLHGRATEADVARALDTVAEHLNEDTKPASSPAGLPAVPPQGGYHGWARRVSDVMTTSVVTVDRAAPYKEIARLLAEHRISGMPVLKMGREVVGVVTEADLLAAEARTAQRLHAAGRRLSLRRRADRHESLIAGALMTSPAITVGPHVTVHAAARLMSDHHVRLLPVVDSRGKLLGVASRRDLLTVFLRPDEDITDDVRRVIDEVLLAQPEEADVTVKNGIVTLVGTLDPNTGAHGDLIPVAIRMMWDVDGVVDVVDHLGHPQRAATAPPAVTAPDVSPEQ